MVNWLEKWLQQWRFQVHRMSLFWPWSWLYSNVRIVKLLSLNTRTDFETLLMSKFQIKHHWCDNSKFSFKSKSTTLCFSHNKNFYRIFEIHNTTTPAKHPQKVYCYKMNCRIFDQIDCGKKIFQNSAIYAKHVRNGLGSHSTSMMNMDYLNLWC